MLRDPQCPGPSADIELSVKTLLQIRDDISRVSDTVNQIEWQRKQIEVIETMLRPAEETCPAKAAFAEEGDDHDAEPASAAPQR